MSKGKWWVGDRVLINRPFYWQLSVPRWVEGEVVEVDLKIPHFPYRVKELATGYIKRFAPEELKEDTSFPSPGISGRND
jgi:hypothetical protein